MSKINLDKILKDVFGYPHFRGDQKKIVQDLIDGKDALVIMPTGGGKSICYQLPALVKGGVAIVISPLISLMEDQIRGLKAMGLEAEMLNSTVEPYHAELIKQELISGDLDLLYIAPERMNDPDFLKTLHLAKISLFAIDEAHCISRWGHDFRPSYGNLNLLKKQFPSTPIIALTATADLKTREDIQKKLNLQGTHYVGGFDRPNITINIQHKDKAKERLYSFIKTKYPKDAGVIYCLSRKKVDDTHDWLKALGLKVLRYHAGLDSSQRTSNMKKFLNEDGYIMVATIAFGMGIDKPNIRFVAHLDTPRNIESYYQEIGRAGRDGLPSEALAFYSSQDIIFLFQMAQEKPNKEEEFKKIMNLVSFLEDVVCRRQWILSYFGEVLDSPCGNCDLCLNPPKIMDYTKNLPSIINAVKNTGESFGLSHISEILKGKESSKIKKYNHTTNSSFGSMAELSIEQIKSVLRQAVGQGILVYGQETKGALALGATKKIFKAADYRQIPFEEEIPKVQFPTLSLLEQLKKCRLEIAQELEIAPYMVFQDKSLKEMVRLMPKSLDDLLNIYGVGKYKVDKYGRKFLDIIKNSK